MSKKQKIQNFNEVLADVNAACEEMMKSLQPTPEEEAIVEKQQDKHLNNLSKLLENEWLNDWGTMYDIIIELVRARYEHYDNGAGVICSEKDRKRITKSLKKCLDKLEYAKNDDNFTGRDSWWSEQHEAYVKAFKYFGKHFEEWWD